MIRRDGSVGDVKVMRGLGLGLNEQAIQAVRQWRFAPATLKGTPVDVIVEVRSSSSCGEDGMEMLLIAVTLVSLVLALVMSVWRGERRTARSWRAAARRRRWQLPPTNFRPTRPTCSGRNRGRLHRPRRGADPPHPSPNCRESR